MIQIIRAFFPLALSHSQWSIHQVYVSFYVHRDCTTEAIPIWALRYAQSKCAQYNRPIKRKKTIRQKMWSIYFWWTRPWPTLPNILEEVQNIARNSNRMLQDICRDTKVGASTHANVLDWHIWGRVLLYAWQSRIKSDAQSIPLWNVNCSWTKWEAYQYS